jgi:hypothetical protein
MRISVPMTLLLAACSNSQSNQDDLQAAANQSTPEAAQVLNGAAENGMNAQAALNEAASAQASNTSSAAPPRLQARPNAPNQPNPPHPGQPPEKVATNSQ